MTCSNLNSHCLFKAILNTTYADSQELQMPFNFANWEIEKFKYQIILNNKEVETSINNYGKYIEPFFLRPLELTILDGNLLNIDSGVYANPISSNFQELCTTESSFPLADIDEPMYERMVINDLFSPKKVFLNFNSSKVLNSPSSNGCAYELDSICLHCLTGYQFNKLNFTCISCENNFNPFTTECIDVYHEVNATPFMFQTNIIHSDPSSYSEEMVGICPTLLFYFQFYPDFQKYCIFPSDGTLSDGFLVHEITLKLNPEIVSSNLTIPTAATFQIFDFFDYTRGELSNQIFHKMKSSDEIKIYLFADYFIPYAISFAGHLPNYRPELNLFQTPIEQIHVKAHLISIETLKSSKNEGEKYLINDLCPDSWHTYVENLWEITCHSNIPSHLRMISTDFGNQLIPCGEHCLTCSSQECLTCEPQYSLIKKSFDCLPELISCFDSLNPLSGCLDLPNYYDALVKSVFFFDYQRAGFIPDDERRVCWRYHTFLQDQGENKEVLIGGWFDSLGTMKLNLQLSFTLLTLCQGIVAFKDEYIYAQIYDEILGIIRPALEYLLLCYVDNDNIYSHCGDLDTDSTTWTRPEDYAGPRKCFKVPTGETATDLYSTMSSAFSVASIVFKDIDAIFSQKLLEKAEDLHTLARASTSDSLMTHFPELFVKYSSSGNTTDELFEAGLFLDKANQNTTNKDLYIAEYANNDFDVINGQGWENRSLNVNLLLFEMTRDSQYLSVLEDYFENWMTSQKSGVYGISNYSEITNLHSLTMTMFHGLILNKTIGTHTSFQDWTKNTMNFILGKNFQKTSLLVGFGDHYVSHSRHKGSSCASPPNACSSNDETKSDPNPNQVIGGLVTGIDASGNIVDSRASVSNEIRLINNAPISAILVKLFATYGELADVDSSIFPKSDNCSNGTASAYPSTFTSNLDWYIMYMNQELPSPFEGPISYQCIYPCIDCNETDCFQCDFQYFLENGVCTRCLKKCISCTNSSSCLVCMPGYKLNFQNICVECTSNCIDCTSNEICDVCEKGYKKDSKTSLCVLIDINIDKNGKGILLRERDKNKGIEDFEKQTFQDEGISNCKIFEKGKCSFCEFGFYWNGINCSSCIEDCLYCSNSIDCILCQDGFALNLKDGKYACIQKQVAPLLTFLSNF